MNFSESQMLKLMAYADGELEESDRAEVMALLASNADAARFIEELGGLGTIVAEGYTKRHAPKLDTFDVADAVMAKIPAVAVTEKSNVASLAEARQRRSSNVRIGVAALVAVAVAATFALFTRPKEAPMAKGPTAPSPAEVVTGSASGSNVVATTSNGVGIEVNAVESPGHSVSVFYLPSANELSTSVVVWVDETGEK